MSGIFGIIHLDGQPIDPATLQTMQVAMQYWGPDGSALWQEGPVGLGHLLLYNTPESVYETLPLRSPAGDLVLTARARLDNRDELCDALGVRHPERPTTPDGALILKAYEKWGEACPDHLLGDWVFAVWDIRRRCLFLARDHHGNTGLYYYHSPRFFAFASCLKGLLALPQVPRRLNSLRVVQIITSWPEQGAPTAYEEIFRLPPAHVMTATADRVSIWQYWRLEDAPDIHLKSDDEYVEAFLSLYTEAVRCRLRSYRPIGAMLSGGLDSSSVCALATPELKKCGQRLLAFSSVPSRDTNGLVSAHRFGDETSYIEATSQFVDNIEVHYIRADNVTPLQGVQHGLWMHDEPSYAAANYYWITALLATAQQYNIGTLLTGQHGNATVSWTGSPAAPAPLAFLKAGRYRQAVRSTVRVLLPDAWLTWYRRRRVGKDPWMNYSALNHELARQLNLTRLMRAHGHDPAFIPPPDPRLCRYLILKPGESMGGTVWQEIGAAHSMEARDPTCDKRLMEFCLGVPDEQYSCNGWNRWLIRRAMEGRLPPKVQWNTLRGFQAADLGHRIVQSQEEIATALDQLEQSPVARQHLELPLMRHVFYGLRARVDRKGTTDSITILLRGLMAGLFLLRFDAGTKP